MHTSATSQAASDADAEDLAALRVRAMQLSLEQLGRFEPRRARARFVETFCAAHTRHIEEFLAGGHQRGELQPRGMPHCQRGRLRDRQRGREVDQERDQHRDRDHRCLHAQPDRIDKFPTAQHRFPGPQRRLAQVRRTGPERRDRHEDQRQQGQQRGPPES